MGEYKKGTGSGSSEGSDDVEFDWHQWNSPSVIDIISQKKFTYSAEIIPPRNGTDFLEVFSFIRDLKKGDFDFISVTHGAGGSLRGGTLPIAYHTQSQFGMTSIAHLTCRGNSREELENILIDHHYFGLHNILALRGDPPDGINSDFKNVSGGFHYAWELVELIKNLNEGNYLTREGYDKEKVKTGMKTRFCIGVASYPDDHSGKDIEYLKVKKDAGANFSITQLVFDPERFFSFYEKVDKQVAAGFPVFPGIRIPSSFKQLSRMKEKFGISVSIDLLNAMEKAQDNPDEMKKIGFEWSLRFIEKLKQNNFPGIHFFIMGKPQEAIDVRKSTL